MKLCLKGEKCKYFKEVRVTSFSFSCLFSSALAFPCVCVSLRGGYLQRYVEIFLSPQRSHRRFGSKASQVRNRCCSVSRVARFGRSYSNARNAVPGRGFPRPSVGLGSHTSTCACDCTCVCARVRACVRVCPQNGGESSAAVISNFRFVN